MTATDLFYPTRTSIFVCAVLVPEAKCRKPYEAWSSDRYPDKYHGVRTSNCLMMSQAKSRVAGQFTKREMDALWRQMGDVYTANTINDGELIIGHRALDGLLKGVTPAEHEWKVLDAIFAY